MALVEGSLLSLSFSNLPPTFILMFASAWVASLTPLSVDGMIVAASITLLPDSRSGRKGEVLARAL